MGLSMMTELLKRARTLLLLLLALLMVSAGAAVSWPLGGIVFLLLAAGTSAWRRGWRPLPALRQLPRSPAFWGSWLLTGLGTQTALAGLTSLTLALEVYLFPSLGAFLLENDPGDLMAKPLVGFVLGLVVVPIVEELLFRGVIFGLLRPRVGFRVALVLSSLLFGLGHGDPLGHFVFGAWLATAYAQTGTLAVPIFLHALTNALVMGVEHFEKVAGLVDAHPAVVDFYSADSLKIGAACLVVGAPFLVASWRRSLRELRARSPRA